MRPHSLQSLREVHERLLRQFVDHQVALTELDFERAGRILDRFAASLREHIRYEEEVLLPLYEAHAPDDRARGPEVLRDEHRKIEALLGDQPARLTGLHREDPEARRRVIAVLDDQRIFKELLRHHDEREARGIYAVLDEVCPEAERDRMLRAGTASHEG